MMDWVDGEGRVSATRLRTVNAGYVLCVPFGSASQANRESPIMATADSERDERLIDESLMETFPASDPTSPARPGSLVGMRYATGSRAGNRSSTRTRLQSTLLGALVAGVVVGIALMRARRSGS
jgi:hypothetical protein